MADNTKIEWCDASLNLASGCTPYSEGCKNCYGRSKINRFKGRKGWPSSPDKVTLFPERMVQPFKWRKPRRIFINSMSDTFHPEIPFEYIAAIFGMMAANPRHLFMVLTKRDKRMLEWFEWLSGCRTKTSRGWVFQVDACWEEAEKYVGAFRRPDRFDFEWPLKNVMLGVSVEDQLAANTRIPILLQTPASKRFLSAEPLLGPIDFESILGGATESRRLINGWHGISQMIAGSETGPGARPMHINWARNIRDQCQESGVSFFFKKDSKGRRELDGKIWEEFPE